MSIKFNIKQLSLISKNLKSYKIGDLLVNSGLITQEQLLEALAEQKLTGHKLGAILLKQNAISATQLYRRLALQYSYKIIALFLGTLVMFTSFGSSAFAGYLGSEYHVSRSAMNSANSYPKLFGSKEVKSNDISAFTKWISMISRYDEQLNSADANTPNVKAWKEMVDGAKSLSDNEKIEAVNSFINKFRYIEDNKNYGKSDYWATPIEFLSKGGDCEDFAIAKYVSLKALGFKDEQLRIAIVDDKLKGISHAILVVYNGGDSLVLDNQSKDIKSSTSVSYYKPIFSINTDAWWMHSV